MNLTIILIRIFIVVLYSLTTFYVLFRGLSMEQELSESFAVLFSWAPSLIFLIALLLLLLDRKIEKG